MAPFSLDVLRAARHAVRRRGDTAVGIDVLAEINRIQTGRATTVKEKKAAKRDSVNTSVVPPLTVAAEPETQANTPEQIPPPSSSRRRAARRIDDEDDEE